jgi:ketosteroid isomerase-like protein
VSDEADRPDAESRAPDVIRRYFAAHDQRDSDAALAAFAPDAMVVDDGHEYVGTDQIRHFFYYSST